jgi:hypothetical protein
MTQLKPETEAFIRGLIARHERMANGWRRLLALLKSDDSDQHRLPEDTSLN